MTAKDLHAQAYRTEKRQSRLLLTVKFLCNTAELSRGDPALPSLDSGERQAGVNHPPNLRISMT